VDLLRARATVLEEEYRIPALLVEVRWAAFKYVELKSVDVNCLVVERGKFMLLHQLLEGFVLFEDLLVLLCI